MEAQAFGGMLNETSWVSFDEAKCVDKSVEIVVQINGKVREKITIGVDDAQDIVLEKARSLEKIKAACEGKTVVKEIYIKGRLVNIVVK